MKGKSKNRVCGEWTGVLSHPSGKNKDAARMGHPDLVDIQRKTELLADGGDEEEILVVAGGADGGAGGDGLGGIVGYGAPDFAFHEDVAGGCQRFHGGGDVADEGFNTEEGFTAGRAEGETQQEYGDETEGDADGEGEPGVDVELRDRSGNESHH